jgi:hypothetical protein
MNLAADQRSVRERCETYSYLKAVIGSTRTARSTGPAVAVSATTNNTTTTLRSIIGSAGLSSGTKNMASGRVANAAMPRPIVTPTIKSDKLCRTIIPTIAILSAPSAMRNPISRIRRLTAYASTPYKPMDASARPSSPIVPSKPAPTRLGRNAKPNESRRGFTSTAAEGVKLAECAADASHHTLRCALSETMRPSGCFRRSTFSKRNFRGVAIRFGHSLTYLDQFRPKRHSWPGCRKPSSIKRLDL